MRMPPCPLSLQEKGNFSKKHQTLFSPWRLGSEFSFLKFEMFRGSGKWNDVADIRDASDHHQKPFKP